MTLLHAAPTGLRPLWNGHIETEIRNAREGRPAHIWAKVNSLQDTDIIKRLYEASQAGVKVDLVVRGVCGVKAGLPGVSENIRVVSILGRHLEHHRIFRFLNGGRDNVYLASADWMVRNLDKRVETCFPILDAGIKARVIRVLDAALADNIKAREMDEDGVFTRSVKAEDAPGVNFQAWCYDSVSGAPTVEIPAAPAAAPAEKPAPAAPAPVDESVFRAPDWIPDEDDNDPLEGETPLPRPDKE